MKVVVAVLCLAVGTASAENPLQYTESSASMHAGFARASQPELSGGDGQLEWTGQTIGIDGGPRFGQQLALILNVELSFFHAEQVVGAGSAHFECDGQLIAATVNVEYTPVPFVFLRGGGGSLFHAANDCHGTIDPSLRLQTSENVRIEGELRAGLRAHLGKSPYWLELAAAIQWYGAPGDDTDAHYKSTAAIVLGFRGTFGHRS
ncbi:MAG TPA: hypothetical protein VGM88_28680 [Kofleriaceae bacterium]